MNTWKKGRYVAYKNIKTGLVELKVDEAYVSLGYDEIQALRSLLTEVLGEKPQEEKLPSERINELAGMKEFDEGREIIPNGAIVAAILVYLDEQSKKN